MQVARCQLKNASSSPLETSARLTSARYIFLPLGFLLVHYESAYTYISTSKTHILPNDKAYPGITARLLPIHCAIRARREHFSFVLCCARLTFLYTSDILHASRKNACVLLRLLSKAREFMCLTRHSPNLPHDRFADDALPSRT